ncbi:MAG: AmmeMemoRadiSam system radical SAM enzyme [Verrucomicrobia bacterium]|nr:AmmeMemoRadiSam system radical SAM enzyme [Verrucomicrobiota bacterium]MCG2679358.1 AmmeMemoRadiSam system radical SAM enzyme [Kiritimatiellia bacterium]MBU4248565.1 AmmeMemoRadiSam system radical SAM enzyme [Verrucomicrobiota bacterium]MBU4291935.1 AmmeMemoRadiSam system radical SAM enzyme [Verrucomicrobiota bacterium]MBU4428959.1 AmmeMemoRadiSam system radical SAM enzyme [Verrucomicrobiota bacterium]
MRPAKFWHPAEAGKIQCELCPHHCILPDQQVGRCGIRVAIEGQLQARGYGLISSRHNDPIEKKPLYHFHPGREIFSIGGWGCNLACQFCQNWTISQQVDGKAEIIIPESVVRSARAEASVGIAYTYNEPLINIEFVRDCAELARKAGLVNVLVTNGYLEEKPAEFLLPLIDALNIDIKSMDDAFYRKQCRGSLEPVLRFSRQAVAAGCHVEITNLLIPGLNDAEEQVGRLSRWIREHLGKSVPLHLSAYRPEYRMTLPPTPVVVLERAYKRCRCDLEYVYLGNMRTDEGQNTVCPQCGSIQISRSGYATRIMGLVGGACAKCGRKADVIMKG